MSNNSKPAFTVYAVNGDNTSEEAHWLKLGAAFRHKDGHGFSITLNALPLNGRLVLREPKNS